MTLLGWILLVGEVVSIPPAWRAVFRVMDGHHPLDWEDLILAAFMATVTAGFVAPFFWPARFIHWLVTDFLSADPQTLGRRLGGESQGEKLGRLVREAQEREARIARKERELGLEEGGDRDIEFGY